MIPAVNFNFQMASACRFHQVQGHQIYAPRTNVGLLHRTLIILWTFPPNISPRVEWLRLTSIMSSYPSVRTAVTICSTRVINWAITVFWATEPDVLVQAKYEDMIFFPHSSSGDITYASRHLVAHLLNVVQKNAKGLSILSAFIRSSRTSLHSFWQ